MNFAKVKYNFQKNQNANSNLQAPWKLIISISQKEKM